MMRPGTLFFADGAPCCKVASIYLAVNAGSTRAAAVILESQQIKGLWCFILANMYLWCISDKHRLH